MNAILFAGVSGVVLAALVGVQTVRVDRLKDDLLTARLHDKDQAARIYNLGRDIADRDARVWARASSEAADRGDADRSCAGEISLSFQKGVAVGRAISHASTSPTSAAADQRPAAGGLQRDYRQAWSLGAYTPGS